MRFLSALCIVFALASSSPITVQAAQLTCLWQKGLKTVLERVEKLEQLARNDFGKRLNKHTCSLNQKPLVNQILQGFYTNQHGLIFPIYLARVARPQGTKVYTLAGGFMAEHWFVSYRRGKYYGEKQTGRLVARSCKVQFDFLRYRANKPWYMGYRKGCRRYQYYRH